MLAEARGSANESGNATKIYEKDEVMVCKHAWQETLAGIFVAEGLAIELKVSEPKETKSKAKPKKKKTTKKSS